MTDQADAPDSTIPDLRVAVVTEAGPHPDADRILLLQADLGGGDERQLVAGVVGHYEYDELEGLHIVVVANLAPAVIRGEESQGMLLARESGDSLGLLLAPDADAGTPLRAPALPEPPEEISFTEFQAHELVAGADGVTLDGESLEGARLVMDREVYGKLR